MLARYRVVVLIYVITFLLAAFMSLNPPQPFNFEMFWHAGLYVGTAFSAFWLLVCWVIAGHGGRILSKRA